MRSISPKHNEELQRRSAHAILRDRLPEDWAAMIAKLPLEVRPMVGRIVWWDWFSMRLVPHRWHHLDQYLKHCQTLPSDEAVIAALIAMGYPQKRAENRVKVNPREDISATKGATGYRRTSPPSGDRTATP